MTETMVQEIKAAHEWFLKQTGFEEALTLKILKNYKVLKSSSPKNDLMPYSKEDFKAYTKTIPLVILFTLWEGGLLDLETLLQAPDQETQTP